MSMAWKLLGFIFGLGAAAAAGAYFMHGFDQSKMLAYELAVQKSSTKAVQIAAADQMSRDAITLGAAETHAAKLAAIVAAFRPIHDEVVRYVPVQAAAKCVVPVGFVRLLDAAATATDPDALPGTAGEPDVGAPSDITLPEIAALSVRWAQQYFVVRQQLLDLQAHDRAQVGLNKPFGSGVFLSSNPSPEGVGSMAGNIVAATEQTYHSTIK